MIAAFDKMPQMSPEMAARRICKGIDRNEARIKFGRGSIVIDVLQRLLPASYWNLMARGADLPKSRSKPGDS
jgi:hypothetical protein